MKKIHKLIPIISASLILGQTIPAQAADNPTVQVENTKAVQYDPMNDRYELKNIEADTVLDLFSADEDFDLVSLSVTRAGIYTADYYVRGSYAGINNESVPITWTVNMNMTTTRINNVDYAQFVSIRLGPVVSLGSGSYTIAQQSSPSGSITNGGSRLVVSQILQLQTVTGHSINAGASAGWISIGAAGSGTYYHRGPSRTVTGVYTLPLYSYAG